MIQNGSATEVSVLVLENSYSKRVSLLLSLIAIGLLGLNLFYFINNGTLDLWLLVFTLIWIASFLIRLAFLERFFIEKRPPRIRIESGRIWPRRKEFALDSGIYVESRDSIVLFFQHGNEMPVGRLRRNNPMDAVETIARIRRFMNDEPEPANAYSDSPKLFTWILIAMNTSVFIADSVLRNELLENGFLSRSVVMEGQIWRIWTSMFLHAGFAHIVMNMMATLSLLSFLEIHVGWKKSAICYFISGTFAALWALLWLGDRPMVGASGAIFGLLGMIAWLTFRGRSHGWNPELLPSRGQIMQMLAINLLISLLPSISLAAHFGGFVAGWILAALLLSRMPQDPGIHS